MTTPVEDFFAALDAANNLERPMTKYFGDTTESMIRRMEAWEKVHALRAKLLKDCTTKAPENEVHKELGFLTKRHQGYVMGIFRKFNLVYNPRDAGRQTSEQEKENG